MGLTATIARARLYLKVAGPKALAKAIIAKAGNSVTLLRIDRSDCRFPFALRVPSSDLGTFEQIFASNAYDFVVEAQPRVIVDAGANIGLASIYFANRYPQAKIIAIEPETTNFELLKSNVAPYPNIVPLQAALWHANEEIDLCDPGRGKWGFVTQGRDSEKGAATAPQAAVCHPVKAITVDRLIADFALDRIDILKIDIEGAEKEVFSDTASWIEKVDAIVIELHDRFRPGCRESLQRGARGFDHEWPQDENIVLTRGQKLRKRAA